MQQILIWFVLAAAALLEAGSDVVIRKGLRGGGWPMVAAGCAVLALYGVAINLIQWDFAKLLGVYIAFFATASILCGLFVLRETIPISTWLGLALIIAGGLVIQFGPQLVR